MRAWALENGKNKDLRIALCGYEGDHNALEDAGWDVVAWKANGGYGNRSYGKGRENAYRERIWFSPHCLKPARARQIAIDEVSPDSSLTKRSRLPILNRPCRAVGHEVDMERIAIWRRGR